MPARMRHLRHRDLDGLARNRLDHTKQDLSLGIPAGSKPEFVFTADNATDQILIAGQDALATNNPRVILEGNLPNGLETGVIYWLSDAGTNLYQLHPTKVDASADTNPVTFTTNGTGTLYITILD